MKDGVPFFPIFLLNCFRHRIHIAKQKKSMKSMISHFRFTLLSCNALSCRARERMLPQLRLSDLLENVVIVKGRGTQGNIKICIAANTLQ